MLIDRFLNVCRIAHADGVTGREASIAGFEERPPEPSECGICLDALEEVAVNGCSHKLCGGFFCCAVVACRHAIFVNRGHV